jgi:hypothetical protein
MWAAQWERLAAAVVAVRACLSEQPMMPLRWSRGEALTLTLSAAPSPLGFNPAVRSTRRE